MSQKPLLNHLKSMLPKFRHQSIELQRKYGDKVLTLQHLVSIKRSYLLKQACSFKLRVCLSMFDLFVNTRR